MSWTKLPPIEGSVACLTCGAGARSDIGMARMIAVGFGDAGYSRDGETLWSEMGADPDAENFPTVADVEKLAVADPDRDWRIYFHSPMYDAVYQRHGDGLWALVQKGEGFA